MEFIQLIYFKNVATFQSISKAAEYLHVSQPTISISIKKLEDELGLQLFDHSKKPLSLTPFGSAILPRVDVIAAEMTNIGNQAKDYLDSFVLPIRLGLPLTLCNDIIFPLVSHYSENKNVQLTICQYGTEETAKKIASGQLDIGIACSPDEQKNCFVKYKDIEFYAYFSKKLPLGENKYLTPEIISNYNLLVAETENSEVEQMLLKYIRKYNIQSPLSKRGILMPTGSLILTELTNSISFHSPQMLEQTPNLEARPMRPKLTVPLYLMWNKNTYLSEAHKKLISYIKSLK